MNRPIGLFVLVGMLILNVPVTLRLRGPFGFALAGASGCGSLPMQPASKHAATSDFLPC